MGKSLPDVGSVYRSLGQGSSWERLGCGVMDKRANVIDHLHFAPPTYSLIWIIEGSGVYYDEVGRAFPFNAGDCFHRLPGRSHSTQPDTSGGWVEWFVDCGPGLFNAFTDLGLLREEPLVWKGDGIPQEALQRFRRALSRASAHELPHLASDVMGFISRARESIQIDQVTDVIDQACIYLADASNDRLDLRLWCQQHAYNYEQFRKAFTKRMGEPPGQYRIRRRMERACSLLMVSDLSIAAVADKLGYASPYEFSAQFRRRFDMSPKQYRQINLS